MQATKLQGKLVKLAEQDIGICKWCRATIAWITSKRTGKRYPCDFNEFAEHRQASPTAFHNCSPTTKFK